MPPLSAISGGLAGETKQLLCKLPRAAARLGMKITGLPEKQQSDAT
jgi:hypothetical protein